MKNYCFKSDKYVVNVTENGITKSAPVYIALICDGDGNNKKLPDEINEIWNGLGQGTNTTKTYFTVFEFENKNAITFEKHLTYWLKCIKI